jgi:hypothetical protein
MGMLSPRLGSYPLYCGICTFGLLNLCYLICVHLSSMTCFGTVRMML